MNEDEEVRNLGVKGKGEGVKMMKRAFELRGFNKS